MAGVEIEQPKRAAAGRRQGTGVETEQQKRASGNFVLGIVYDRFRPGDLGVAGVEIEQPKARGSGAAAGHRSGDRAAKTCLRKFCSWNRI